MRRSRPLRLASLRGRLQGASDNGRYTSRRATSPSASRTARWWRRATSTSLDHGSDAGGTLAAAAIELEPLARLAASLPLPERVAQAPRRGQAARDGSRSAVEWRGEPQAPAGFAARASSSTSAPSRSSALPDSPDHRQLRCHGSGRARVLATRKGELNLPRVFPEPRIALDFLNGLVEWERQGDAGIALRIESLTFSNAHVSGNAHGTYVAAAVRRAVDLSAQLNRADATSSRAICPHARSWAGDRRASGL
jgi:uncharacterized protein YhdP